MKTYYQYNWDDDTSLFKAIALDVAKQPFTNCMITEHLDTETLTEKLLFRFYGAFDGPDSNSTPFQEFAINEKTLMQIFKEVKSDPSIKRDLAEFKKTIPKGCEYAETVFLIRATSKECKSYKFSVYFRHTGEKNGLHINEQ